MGPESAINTLYFAKESALVQSNQGTTLKKTIYKSTNCKWPAVLGQKSTSLPRTWNSIRPPGATLTCTTTSIFAALEHNAIGIRLASEGVKAVKCHDTKCDAKPRCKMRYKTRCKMHAQLD